ncbi:MAG TPA: potassium-transporting ATPase subunit KdpA, partial [Thermomicrobiaceae bacterium]|nr:potassium-transporting ATPase subunit KdpA [Thermomicrobiaceae bacterium]
MTVYGWLQVAALFLIVLALTRPVGAYMARVFSGERTLLGPVLGPVERAIYRISGVNPEKEQGWLGYTVAVLVFTLFGILTTYLIERLQGVLPFNPQHLAGVNPDLAFNTAVSFNTNTNWQNYVPEATMSYLTEMAALAVHNFLSAAAGISIAIAVIRGFARRRASAVGNFWVDLTRVTLYVLLPICIVFALVLVWRGVPQNLSAYTQATTLQGATQTIAQGPVASQEIIKELGTNGGGFFNANSAHPFENPTPFTNLLEMVAILTIGAGLTYTFGKMVGNTRQGWALFAVMSVIYLGAVFVAYRAETGTLPALSGLHIDQALGNLSGKETRFGSAASALF